MCVKQGAAKHHELVFDSSYLHISGSSLGIWGGRRE